MTPPKGRPIRIEATVSPARAAATRATRVLVVDDEVDILRSTQMLLEQLEFEAIVLPDPDLVVEVAEEEQPDVILQDLMMPGLDLPDTVRRLRKNPKTRNIPLILYSASSDVASAAAEYDAAGFLSKPFTENALREVLRVALAQRQEAEGAGDNLPAPIEAQSPVRVGLNAYFHGFMNTIAALNNYALYLASRPGLSPQEKEAGTEMTRLLLDLEERTDQLRLKLLELAT